MDEYCVICHINLKDGLDDLCARCRKDESLDNRAAVLATASDVRKEKDRRLKKLRDDNKHRKVDE